MYYTLHVTVVLMGKKNLVSLVVLVLFLFQKTKAESVKKTSASYKTWYPNFPRSGTRGVWGLAPKKSLDNRLSLFFLPKPSAKRNHGGLGACPQEKPK
jgi:hypothetical protein